MDFLPLESGRHYKSNNGHRLIVTSVRAGGVAEVDIVENDGSITLGSFQVHSGAGMSHLNLKVVGFWINDVKNYECKCSSLSLFRFGHEKGCAWMERKIAKELEAMPWKKKSNNINSL